MSIFTINRYGEEIETTKEGNDSQNHLAQLLQKIAERKKQKEAEAVKVAEATKVESPKKDAVGDVVKDKTKVSDEVNNEVSKKKGKKKKGKKRKLDEALNEVVADEKESAKDKTTDENNQETKESDSVAQQQDFTILGSKKHLKTQAAKRVLPHWLTHPDIVSPDVNSGASLEKIESLLDSKIVEKLRSDGFNKLFPVQEKVLPWLIQCDKDYRAGKWVRDTCVSMPTGSGKTLAYVLPIIQILKNNFVRMVRCLIVLPVQELATQVYEVMLKFSQGTSLRTALITGAFSFQEEQERLVKKIENNNYISQVDIVIATPGRLVDHIRKTEGFSLKFLRFLVIDEADRATDWLQYIPFPHSKAPPLTIGNVRSSWNTPASKILLSATLSQDPEKLSRLGLFRPILFTSAVVDLEKIDKDLNLDEDLNKFTSCYGNPNELTERIVECTLQYKPLAVYYLLTQNKVVEKTLIFTNSSEAAHRLAILLQSLFEDKGVNIAELSAQLGSKQREKTLDDFVQGKIQVLVSSDALARGIDVPKIKLVISYDLPKFVKGYIHRAGRTGRGGYLGTAVSLLLPNQIPLFDRMLHKVGKNTPSVEKTNLDDLAKSVNYNNHLENLKTELSDEQVKNLHRLKSHKRATRT